MRNLETSQKEWTQIAEKVLLNRHIIGVQYIPFGDDYNDSMGIAIKLDNGTILNIMSDDEGNDFGSIHYQLKNGQGNILPRL